MLARYSRPAMAAIWAPENRLRLWLEVELEALAAMAALGQVPKASAAAVRSAGRSPDRGDHRSRADRGDRDHHAPRRDRVLDPPRGGDRPRGALSASRHDLLGPARHRLRPPADPGGRPSARRSRSAAGRAPPPGVRAQGDALHRPLARHARRAHHLRPQARRLLRRVRAQPAPAAGGARGSRDLRDLRRGRDLRQCRPRGRGPGRGPARPRAGADLDPGHPARPPRRVLRHARHHRERRGAPGDRDPASPAQRGRRRRPSPSAAARRAARRCPTSAIPG